MQLIVYLFMVLLSIPFLLTKKTCSCVSLYKGFVFGYIFYYGIIPLVIYLMKNDFSMQYSKYFRINQMLFYADTYTMILMVFMFFLGIVTFRIAYKLSFGGNIYIGEKYPLSKNQSSYLHTNIEAVINSKRKGIKRVAFVVFIFSTIALVAYIYGTGGLARALSLVEINRSHSDSIVNYGVSRIYTYALLIAGFIPTSSLVLLSLLEKNRFKDKVLFFISLVLSVIYFLCNGGRSPLLLYFVVVFYCVLSNLKIKHIWVIIFPVSICCMPLLDVLDAVFADASIISNREQLLSLITYDFKPFISQFSIPCISAVNLNGILDVSGYQFFIYIFTDVLSLLPLVSFKMSYNQISYFYKGSAWVNQGGIPTDIITYGYLQLNFLGVIIIFMLFGLIFGKIDRLLESNPPSYYKNILGVILATSAFNIACSADLYVILQRNTNLLLITILLILTSKYNRKATAI